MKKFLCSVMITALALGTVTVYANENDSRFVLEVIEEEVPPVYNNTIPGVLSYGLENITGLYEAIAEAEKGLLQGTGLCRLFMRSKESPEQSRAVLSEFLTLIPNMSRRQHGPMKMKLCTDTEKINSERATSQQGNS